MRHEQGGRKEKSDVYSEKSFWRLRVAGPSRSFYFRRLSDSAFKIVSDNNFDLATTEEKAIAALPQLMAGKQHHTADDAWAILMRPVPASNQERLNCHTNAKLGATLGVMVYAVRKIKTNPPVQVGMR